MLYLQSIFEVREQNLPELQFDLMIIIYYNHTSIDCILIIFQTYYLHYLMKFNELKNFFEKSGAIKSNIIPQKQNSRTISAIQVRPPSIYNALSSCSRKDQSKSSISGIQNNDFLKELNQKLLNQSTKVKQTQNVTISQGIAVVNQQQQYFPNQRMQPILVNKEEEELNFDDILLEIAKTSVMQSPVQAARMAINPRYSLDQSSLDIFSSKKPQEIADEHKIQESVINSKVNEQSEVFYKKQKAYSRETEAFYKRKEKQERIKRVNRIIGMIFKDNEKVRIKKQGIDEVVSIYKSPEAKPRRGIFLSISSKKSNQNNNLKQLATTNI